LSFDGDAERLASDTTCLLRGQGETCGFEQPLEAILKSLWPEDDDTVVFLNDDSGAGRHGHGGAANGAFLRDDSLLVVLVVMGEDDCSALDTTLFSPADVLEPSDPLASQALGLRCALNPDRLFPVERYVNGLHALRPGHEDSIVFAAIAGVPAERTAGELEAGSDAAAVSFYDELLDAPEMQVNVDEQAMVLEPICTSGDVRGYPARRLVETARGFGANSMVRSICEDGGDATRAIVRLVADRLGSP
jgi:hypothetical protein